MHEPTFRRACAEAAGLNPFLCEMANLREHCSWVHEKGEATTEKAIDLVRILVEKVKRNQAAPADQGAGDARRALVIGGGIAGIQAALDIANAGHEVILVENEPVDRRPHAPALRDLPDPRLLAVHPDAAHGRGGPAPEHHAVHLLGAREPRRLHRQLQGDDPQEGPQASTRSSAPAAALCMQKCPVKKIPSEFNAGLGTRPAIYVPFPQAVPNKPVIDRDELHLLPDGQVHGSARRSARPSAIRFDQEDEIVEADVGAVVLATGFDIKHGDFFPEYGYGKYTDVIDGLQFERLASASGPTLGEMKRPVRRQGARRRSSSSPAPARATRPRASPTARRSAACTRPSTPCSTSTRCTTARPTSSTWTSAPAARCTRSSSAARSRRTACKYIRGRVSRIYEANGKLVVKGADTLLGGRADGDRGRHGGAGDGGASPATAPRSWPRSCTSATTRTTSSPRPTRSCGRSRRTRPASSWPAPARRRRTSRRPSPRPPAPPPRCAALFSQPELTREPVIAVVDRQPPPRLFDLRRLLPLPDGLPLPGDREGGDPRPQRQADQDRGQGEPGPLPGLRHLRRPLPHEGDRPAGLHQRAGLRRSAGPVEPR